MEPGSAPAPVFPFFTGCQRSGTTLIRVIFNAHPDLAIPPESHFITELARRRSRYERPGGFDVARFVADLETHERYRRWKIRERKALKALDPPPADLAEAIRRIYRVIAARKDKPLFGDKTPRYAMDIPLLADLFPESKFIHVMRDGRNVALSVLEVPWGPTSIDRGALYWRDRVTAARAAGRALGPERYIEYRHEDLVDDPEGVVGRLCAFIGIGFDPQMLRYYENRGPGRAQHMQHLAKPPTKGLREWQQQMTPEDLRIFEILAGDVLTDLGYDLASDASTLTPEREAAAQRRARVLRRRHGLVSSPAVQRALQAAPGRWVARAYTAARGGGSDED